MNPNIHSLSSPLYSLLLPALPRMPSHVAMDTTTAIQQNTNHKKKKNSPICLLTPYMQVCLPGCLHLLACVTSRLSHYLPVCISVCPPASAPLLPDISFFSVLKWEKGREQETMVIFALLANLPSRLLYATTQYDTIYYSHGLFYVPSFPFFIPLLLYSPSPQLWSQFAGRQEGWLRAAVPLPKLTASMDERPPLIFACLACCCQSRQLHIHRENVFITLCSYANSTVILQDKR